MKQFINFTVAGGIGYVIKFCIAVFLTEIIHVSLGASYLVSLLFIVMFGFVMNKQVIFKNHQNGKTKFVLYLFTLSVLSGIDWLIVTRGSAYVPYPILMVLSTGVIFLAKFKIYKGLIFVDYDDKGGNYFDKHNSKNPMVQFLMKDFYTVILRHITANQGQTCIDIGCGEGHLTNMLEPMTKRYHRTS